MLLARLTPGAHHAILATDIDDAALERARGGRGYSAANVASLPADLRGDYLSRSGEAFDVVPAIRHRVRFRRHDLLRDEYPAHQDLVLCRNVVIYLTDDAKRRVYEGFAASLRAGGVLFVGGSEMIIRPGELGLKLAATSMYQRAA
jgi:chemotaxis protein methyltransferase CheR